MRTSNLAKRSIATVMLALAVSFLLGTTPDAAAACDASTSWGGSLSLIHISEPTRPY